MRCPLAMQSLKVGNRLLAVLWSAAVNPLLLEKMPTFAISIIKYRWVAHVCGNDQCIRRCNFLKFQTGIAKLCGRGFVKGSRVKKGQNCKRSRKRYRQGHGRNSRRNFRSKKSACSAGKCSSNRHE